MMEPGQEEQKYVNVSVVCSLRLERLGVFVQETGVRFGGLSQVKAFLEKKQAE